MRGGGESILDRPFGGVPRGRHGGGSLLLQGEDSDGSMRDVGRSNDRVHSIEQIRDLICSVLFWKGKEDETLH